ncbi:hypothetical protein BBJ28_00005839, partial [Nothophytophthora sp. Chile5]
MTPYGESSTTPPPRPPLSSASFFPGPEGNTPGGGNNGEGVQGGSAVQGAEDDEMAKLVATSSDKLDIRLTGSDNYQEWSARILTALFAMRMSEMVLGNEKATDRPESERRWHDCFRARAGKAHNST